MQEKKLPTKKKIILTVLIFTIVYTASILLWITIQNSYMTSVLYVASHVAAKVKNVDFSATEFKDNDRFGAHFYVPIRGKVIRTFIHFDFSVFVYSVPLSLAIMAALYFFIQNHMRAYIDALIILISFHFIYLFFGTLSRLSKLLAKYDTRTISEFELFVWQVLCEFFGTIAINSTPFLIGIYLYLRFARSSATATKKI